MEKRKAELNKNEGGKPAGSLSEKYGLIEKSLFDEKQYDTVIRIPAGEKLNEPILFERILKAGSQNNVEASYKEAVLIVAEKESSATVVLDLKSADEASHNHSQRVTLYAGENSRLHFVKVQRFNNATLHEDNHEAHTERNAQIQYTLVDLGAQSGKNDYTLHLEGESSRAELKTAYLGDGERKLQMRYTMEHWGRRTDSLIETRGVLKDRSEKDFYGSLDFKRGAKKARGGERETVILLDKGVKSNTIPALFCREEDVEGSHAASAGQIDDNRLFYIMSRGFSEKEAKRLIVEASLSTVLDGLPVNELKKTVETELKRRLEL